jgi:hypothetical protein
LAFRHPPAEPPDACFEAGNAIGERAYVGEEVLDLGARRREACFLVDEFLEVTLETPACTATEFRRTAREPPHLVRWHIAHQRGEALFPVEIER